MQKYFLLLISFVCISCFSVYFQDPTEWHRSGSTIVEFLENAPISKIQPLGDYLHKLGNTDSFTTSDAKIITFSHGNKAIFKPFEAADPREAHAEVAAFKASIFLRFPYVPPTCLRTIDGETGSLQLLVEDSTSIKTRAEFQEALQRVNPLNVAQAKIFSFVMGQWDTSYNNFVIKNYGGHTYLISIDNGNICHYQHVRYGELPFVLIGPKNIKEERSFPFHLAKSLIRPTPETLRELEGSRFLPPRLYTNPPYCFRFVIYENRIWRQYYYSPDYLLNGKELYDEHLGVMPAYTEIYPAESIDALKKLNLESLSPIFERDQEISYLEAILERRNQALQYAKV